MEGKIKYMNGEKNNICVVHETQVIYHIRDMRMSCVVHFSNKHVHSIN